MIKYIRNVARRRRVDADAVVAIERQCNVKYKNELQMNNTRLKEEEEQRKNQNYLEKKKKKRIKFGKMHMVHSRKPSIKRKEVKKEIDPERLAFLQYLGHLSEEEDSSANQKWTCINPRSWCLELQKSLESFDI